jgi:hypothetical protein
MADPSEKVRKLSLVLRQPHRGLCFHSDRGSQYSSDCRAQTAERYWS